jgi:hypothetical protein
VCLELAATGPLVVTLQCCDAVLHRRCLKAMLATKLREYAQEHFCPVCWTSLFPNTSS